MEKIFYKNLNSTNLYANKLLEDQALINPVWIRTDNQFEGRGQGGHTWVSEPGMNLTGSLAFTPNGMDASDQFDLSRLCSLAVSDFLEIFIDNVSIKWPNDLYAGNRKIGGILIESALMGQSVSHSILGIGININQEKFPVKIPNPVSLKNLTGIHYQLGELEDILLETIMNRFMGFLSAASDSSVVFPDREQFRLEYLRRLYRYNEFAPYKASGQWFRARLIGVNPFGHLLLEEESGKTRSFAFQEVEFIL